jgi:hypothetical protein
MEKPIDQMLRTMLRFLALADEEKLTFLPPTSDSEFYIVNEAGDRTRNPLFYYCNAVFELMSRYSVGHSEEFANVAADITALLDNIIATKEINGPMWYLEKKRADSWGTAFSADRLWNILRRLALVALAARGWEAGPPEIPFSETGYSGVRQASVDKWEPGKSGSTDSKEW